MTDAAANPWPQRVLLVSSNGGHLGQLMALEPWWRARQRVWVTFEKVDATSKLTGESVVWAYHPTTRNIPNLLRNTGLALRSLPKLRPDVVVSTGAAVAIPYFLFAAIMRIPRVYIEVGDRLESRTVTGRICHPLSTLFLVQWQEQQRMYPRSVVIGPLL